MKIKFILSLVILFCLSLTTTAQNMVLEFNTNLSAGTAVTLPLYGTVNVTVDWGDGTGTEVITAEGNKDHIYASDGTYSVTISGSLTHFGNSGTANIKKLTRVTDFGDLGITDLSYAFDGAVNLIEVPTTLPTGVTNMSWAFEYSMSSIPNFSASLIN